MKSLDIFLQQFREHCDQLEQILAAMSRKPQPETAPVCVELAISMMCRSKL
jgi:hypothetical protein